MYEPRSRPRNRISFWSLLLATLLGAAHAHAEAPAAAPPNPLATSTDVAAPSAGAPVERAALNPPAPATPPNAPAERSTPDAFTARAALVARAPRKDARAPHAPRRTRFAALAPIRVADKTYYPYSFDGHVHSHHSPDAFNPPSEVLGEAERLGLSALVITDHGNARSKLDFRSYKGRVVPFVGQEIGGPFGHAVFWNVDVQQEVVPSATSLADRAAFAHAHGGLIVLCHPGWWIEGRSEDPMKWITPEALTRGGPSGDIDALELWNGMYDAPLRKLIRAWEDALEAGVYVPIVGNSDFHRLGAHRIGGPRNLVYCEEPEPQRCLWGAVKAGRSVVTDGPSLMLTVDDQPLGSSVQVARGASVDVRVQVDAPQGGELRVYHGKALVHTLALSPHAPLDEHVPVQVGHAKSYVRVEIVRVTPVGEQVLLLSNPIRVEPR